MPDPDPLTTRLDEAAVAFIQVRNADGSGAGTAAKPGSLVELWDANNKRIALLHAADLLVISSPKKLPRERIVNRFLGDLAHALKSESDPATVLHEIRELHAAFLRDEEGR